MRAGLRRSIMSFDQQLAYRPLAANRCGAYCMICNKPSDEEMIKEEARGASRNFCRVLVRCHGAEELRTFEFGSEEWTYEQDLRRAMQRCAWFDPMSHNETAGVANNAVINEPGDHDP